VNKKSEVNEHLKGKIAELEAERSELRSNLANKQEQLILRIDINNLQYITTNELTNQLNEVKSKYY